MLPLSRKGHFPVTRGRPTFTVNTMDNNTPSIESHRCVKQDTVGGISVHTSSVACDVLTFPSMLQSLMRGTLNKFLVRYTLTGDFCLFIVVSMKHVFVYSCNQPYALSFCIYVKDICIS